MGGKKPDKSDDFDALQALSEGDGSVGHAQKSHEEALNALMNTSERAKDNQKEERFIWILILIIFADCHFMMSAQNFGGPLIVGCLEFVLVLVLAGKCGVDEVLPFIDRLLSVVARPSANDGNS